jgi:MoaA/NifB/PqqE/SkfB family radical SAM enzyme
MNFAVEEKSNPGIIEANLSIELTTNCNSPCPHCFARAGISEYSSLPFDLVKEISTEGYNTGYRHFHVTGGEPLLWDGLFDLLDYVFELGYKTVFLNTNGTLLTGDINRRLAEYDSLTISVSLQGPEALHDRIRGAGSYRRTLLGIEKALDEGIGLIIFTTTGRRLLPELAGFVDETYKSFPNILSLTVIQIIRVRDDTVDLSEELLSPEDFIRLVRTVSLLNLYGLRTDVLNEPLVNVASKLLNMPWIPRSQPLYTEGSMMVRANRDMTLSHATRDGSLRYEPGMIRKVLTSSRYRNAVAPDKATCPSCKFAELCPENGMLRPSGWYMDMQPEVPYCRRVLNKVASRFRAPPSKQVI